MPEDVQDKLTDFELMLMGVIGDGSIDECYGTRLMSYWYALSREIKEQLK